MRGEGRHSPQQSLAQARGHQAGGHHPHPLQHVHAAQGEAVGGRPLQEQCGEAQEAGERAGDDKDGGGREVLAGGRPGGVGGVQDEGQG